MLKAGQYASVNEPGGTWYGQVVTAPMQSGGNYRIRLGGTGTKPEEATIVTVPWARVGLHSAFAAKSRLLSAASNAKIDTVMADAGLMGSDTCTAVMAGVMSLLGTGDEKPIKEFDGGGPDGMYGLVVNFCGDINTAGHEQGWEHGMAFQKVGNDIVFYQGWVGTFTLADWLMLTPKALCLGAAKYAPRHPSFAPQMMAEFFTGLKGLPKQWATLVDTGMAVELFSLATAYLFGPESPMGLMQLRTAQTKRVMLRYHWRYKPFKA